MFLGKAAMCFITINLVVNGGCCFAQNTSLLTDTFELKEIVVTDNKVSARTAQQNFKNLESYAGKRLPDLLNEISSVYLKNYGNGQLTTIAVRGTTTSQTEVLWNGIKINSPMLGQSDFALLNVGFHNSIGIQFNQLNTAIGSNILLNNSLPEAATHFEGAIRSGSFGLLQTNMNVSYGNKKIRGATKVALLKAENNFPIFKNEKIAKQTNAEVLQWAFFQQLNYLINARNEIELFAWYNQSQRQIPPTLLQQFSKAFQNDDAVRTMFRWRFNKQRLHFNFTSAYLRETLQYNNYQLLTNDKSVTHAWRNAFNFNYAIKRFVIDANVFADYEKAQSESYESKHQRALYGFSGKVSYSLKQGVNFAAGLRQEFMDIKASPFMPFVSVAFFKRIKSHLIGLEVTGKRSFRFPTFNDLFWINSGSKNLLPENSWNTDATLSYKWNTQIRISATTFYTWVNNQIQWTPDFSGNWRPQNLKSVFARGVEVSAIFTLPELLIPHFNFTANVNYSFTRSIQTKSALINDAAVGKQVIYVPLHRVSSTLAVSFYEFKAQLYYRYTGLRYISTDNSDALVPYSIFDIEFSKAFTFSKSALKFAFRVNNLGNVFYQDVAQMPMLPRNFEGTLSIKL